MPHRLIAITLAAFACTAAPLSAQSSPTRSEPRPADYPSLASTLEALASVLRDTYVYPEIGATMADHLVARLEEGHWANVLDERLLAEQITEELRDISGDKHLRVLHSLRPSSAPVSRGSNIDAMRRDNFAFRRAELLDGNIGYLRFDLFTDHEEAREVAAAALSFLARAEAMIIDLRHNSGGSPNMIRFITSYFFEEPTLLNVMVDRNGDVVDEFHTLASVPGSRFAADLPIYVLTSEDTFSGAEEFAYNLKHLDRATIIGAVTGGGAHPTRTTRLNDRFIVGVPFLRARNPISGTNWEGTGITPHIEVAAEDALHRAIVEARHALLGEESLRKAG